MDTYKKKYEEALEKARNIVNSINVGLIGKDSFEAVFPELAKSEDERIMKEIKDFFSRIMLGQENFLREDYDWNAWIVWLEKQGEHANFRNNIQIGDKVTRNEDGLLVNLSQLKRVAKPSEQNQSKQKPSDVRTTGYWNVQEVEQELAWSEKYIADVFEKVGLAKIVREQSNDNLTNALQDAMIELSKFIPQPKQEWSEEDRDYYDAIITKLEVTQDDALLTDTQMEFLKSLIPQNTWKPSDEQIEALEFVIKSLDNMLQAIGHIDNVTKPRLEEILAALKKLK